MTNKKNTVYKLSFIAILSALSTVLMMINIPLPFAPTFLKFDIAELPALFAGFYLGPVSGCAVVLIKNLLNVIITGTSTAFVGEAMNIVTSICFVLPAALIYQKMHTKKGAIIGMVVGTLTVSIVAIFLNAYVAFPMYGRLFGLSTEAIIGMGHAVNPLVNDYVTMMLFSIFPFNLVKHGITSLVTYLLYKRVGNALRRIMHISEETVSA